MSWYDHFATVYDASVERVYAPYRTQIVAALGAKPGDRVLDLPVGTGPNLPLLGAAVGPTGLVLGVDASAGMLQGAEPRAAAAGAPVKLVEADARALDAAWLAAQVGDERPLDGVVFALGLSVFPDWELVFERTFALLRPGGRCVIFDIHAERRVPQSWMVEWIAGADLSRRTWEPLSKCAADFRHEVLPGSAWVHGGRPFLASGVR